MEPIIGVTKRKRSAPKLRPTRKELDIRSLLGAKHFVCSLTMRLIEKRIVIPGYEEKYSFANIPCAVRFIEQDATSEDAAMELIDALGEYYQQPHDTLPAAPMLRDLCNFMGDLSYADWIGDLAHWDDHCAEQGQTVAQWLSLRVSRTARTKKTVRLLPGVYHIPYRSKADWKDPEQSTVKSVRLVNAFIRRTGGLVMHHYMRKTNYMMMAAKFGSEEKHANVVASRLNNTEETLYGPATLIVLKAMTIRV